MEKKFNSKKISKKIQYRLVAFAMLQVFTGVFTSFAQNQNEDLARYTPKWIRNGFVDTGATHEPWIFQVRRNSEQFNLWQKDLYDHQLSEEYIKALSESGVSLYHVSCYKGFGFKAEKENMDKVAEAVSIAHKYGMKVDTYVQWNTLAYETFFSEVPEAKNDLWYQVDINGNPIMLTYGYQQSFRYRPCFNNDAYLNYFKEKILRYVVETVKTDFIHFDNFDFNPPSEVDFNPATIAAFRKYIIDKYSPEQRIERLGFDDVTYLLPPAWNSENPADKIVNINDPIVQEWIDFRCWTFTSRLVECAAYVRKLNKEVAIEVNPHGIVGSNRAWEAGIDHPDLLQYTNVIWTEDASNNPHWSNGVAIGKFRHYKLGRTTNNFILTNNQKANDFAENLALNRTIGFIEQFGVTQKKYVDFWLSNKELYINSKGAEKVAVLRSYPSMAYNTLETQIAVNMAEQTLQQRQIPFDIIFDQQIERLSDYSVIVLANQESLADNTINAIKLYVANGGGLVVTGNTGKYDRWRRIRKQNLLDTMFAEENKDLLSDTTKTSYSFSYVKGNVYYIPKLIQPEGEFKLGFETTWQMPLNANELESAIYWAAREQLPLEVKAPEWVGVSHDKQKNRDIIHLFNYKTDENIGGVTLEYNGSVKSAWAVSPDLKGKLIIPTIKKGEITELRLSNLKVYTVIVLEK